MAVSEGGWRPIHAPSALAFTPESILPEALDNAGIAGVVRAFGEAARRARQCGFKVIEIHGAHGYLLQEFLSPLTNQRTDEYGGSFENRTRMLREVTAAVRREWPGNLPLFLRISASDWVEGGWTLEDSIALADMVKKLGVDLIDCSSGGAVASAKIPVGAGFQVPFAAAVRRQAGIMTGAVGMITSPQQADQIIRNGDADLVLLAREFLRDPYWPLHAAQALGRKVDWPLQYERARPSA